ncbi:putative Reverse transcriptase (RNA-dependent DNA polymerase)/RNase H [Trypanosoma cruzi]|uniref:Putative Reverse transcriptase (RNA-dependent DNA polymerase)/RNase H n=1 Tax=Trypanosoma cruzi TaxID=5693 RepID=A0A2V2X397_TRYCR|nr:putative Reverse transcriptase (RNA-dependent DNA polymerase)/RNase H [Trypanosoma cruzi]
MWALRGDTSWPQTQRSAAHAARSSPGVRAGTVFVLPLRTPTSQSAEQLCGCHSRHVCGRPLYYRQGQSREDAIPTANMVLQKLHAWSQENGLAINPSKREAAWFTLSTHTESDYDREGKWPLVVAGCQIPVMTMGASRTTKLLGMDLDPRLTLNAAASKQCAATSQRISQLRCIAHKEAGPSPNDLRTFVIGHGASKLRYGSELIWAVATDSAKNEMQKTYATLARIVSGVPSTADPESALLEANMPPLHVLCLRAALHI